MPAAYRTPGVYIVEKDAFPNSIVEVPTAVPAFIGYTQKADDKGKSLLNKPTRLSSLSEFETYFGGPPAAKFTLKEATDPTLVDFTISDPSATGADSAKKYVLTPSDGRYLLYYSLKLFFANGGGPCFIVSVGDLGYPAQGGDPTSVLDEAAMEAGIDALEKFEEPTILVVPDAVLLKQDDCYKLQEHMLMHCGKTMMNRIAVLDLHHGDQAITPSTNPVDDFRNGVTSSFMSYGAAYYPWIETSILQDRDLDYTCIDDGGALAAALKPEMTMPATDARAPIWNANVETLLGKLTESPPADDADPAATKLKRDQLNQSLQRMSPGFKLLLGAAAKHLNLLPPSGAMAGIYKMVDDTRGVWKAPANVGVASAVRPSVPLTSADQEDLNVTPMGKSINAIRAFIGEGVLVWGARTLDGNSLDWRYVNVRRTMIMLEESCKLAAKAYVFEPNVAGTWMSIKSMIENYLTSVWKRGGLAGAVPADAFSVHVGLGDTMTADDILEGRLNVTVLVAISHPAEFIEITFQQQMQKS